ncbi:MAG: NAD(P)-dependent alcohol dehydrogenase [Bacteroidia bacterium]|nr:NAD(P)-dependent alcohol dehydrogenase [Bacteroidia bacterium]
MKTVYYQQYGSPEVLQLKEMPKPVPNADEVLVKVHAANVNYGDITARNFGNISAAEFNMPDILRFFARLSFGWKKPKRNLLGSEFSGEIESVGANVTHFKPGDPVFGYTGMNMCTHSEYLCLKENAIIGAKPSQLSHHEAAALPYGGIMALGLLRKFALRPGQKVLINGASGGIGSFALQIAKHQGAEVTAVCSPAKADYVKSLGADFVFDYNKGILAQNPQQYDLILDVLGKLKWAEVQNLLTEKGVWLLGSFKTGKLLRMLWSNFFGKQKVICAFANEKPEDLKTLRELVEKKAVKVIVDKVFPMNQVIEAHAHYETKTHKGNVILEMVLG